MARRSGRPNSQVTRLADATGGPWTPTGHSRRPAARPAAQRPPLHRVRRPPPSASLSQETAFNSATPFTWWDGSRPPTPTTPHLRPTPDRRPDGTHPTRPKPHPPDIQRWPRPATHGDVRPGRPPRRRPLARPRPPCAPAPGGHAGTRRTSTRPGHRGHRSTGLRRCRRPRSHLDVAVAQAATRGAGAAEPVVRLVLPLG